jgi:hypothetical protein
MNVDARCYQLEKQLQLWSGQEADSEVLNTLEQQLKTVRESLRVDVTDREVYLESCISQLRYTAQIRDLKKKNQLTSQLDNEILRTETLRNIQIYQEILDALQLTSLQQLFQHVENGFSQTETANQLSHLAEAETPPTYQEELRALQQKAPQYVRATKNAVRC